MKKEYQQITFLSNFHIFPTYVLLTENEMMTSPFLCKENKKNITHIALACIPN